MGLLFASAAVPVVVVNVVVIVVVIGDGCCCCCWVRLSWSPSSVFVIVLIADKGLEEFIVAFEEGFGGDHELQVSQPSADREDKRQQDQRLPLHSPVW